MKLGRLIVGSLALIFSAGVLAYPVTYVFTGTVTKYDPLALVYNDNPQVVGMITFDPETGRRSSSGDSPYAVYYGMDFSYQISMAGQSFYGATDLRYAFVRPGQMEFFDEVPGVSAASVDYGELLFNFSGDPFSDLFATGNLPVNQFIGGFLSFGGEPPLPNGGSTSISASIDYLVRVPEPASAALLSAGLLGLLVRRRKRKS